MTLMTLEEEEEAEEVEEGSLGWREVPPARGHSLFLLHCAMNTANTTQAEWQIFFNKHCKRLSCPTQTYFCCISNIRHTEKSWFSHCAH